MIFEILFMMSQLRFSSHYIDDFRGIDRSEGSLNTIALSKVHWRVAPCSFEMLPWNAPGLR